MAAPGKETNPGRFVRRKADGMHGEVTGGNGRGRYTVTWRSGPFTLIEWPNDQVEAVDSEVEVLRAGLDKLGKLCYQKAGQPGGSYIEAQFLELAQLVEEVEAQADLAPADADGLSGWR